jgi:tetratricopeptide (TPR) repeat protein
MGRFKTIDEKIEEGYGLILDNDYTGGCDLWLEAWGLIRELLTEGVAKDIFDLNNKYKWTQYPSNYVQDVEAELRNAGSDDSVYHDKRIKFCEELLQWCGEETISNNARIGIAEAYCDLGDAATADRLYAEWLQDDPEWGWGYIGWSDHYRFKESDEGYAKAEEILLAGYSREGLRDKVDVADRLVELYEEIGDPAKAKEYKAIQSELIKEEIMDNLSHNPSPVRVVKVGRNEPCPCGSGKKYKKCCLP